MSEFTLLRLKRFEMAQRAQKVSVLEIMLGDFESTALDLAQYQDQGSTTYCLFNIRLVGDVTSQ